MPQRFLQKNVQEPRLVRSEILGGARLGRSITIVSLGFAPSATSGANYLKDSTERLAHLRLIDRFHIFKGVYIMCKILESEYALTVVKMS